MNTKNGFQEDVKLKSKPDLDEPKLYRVIMHNDHYTTMDFVVEVLMKVFNKPAAEAAKIMLDIHHRGMGICGVFTFDIASTKVAAVHQLARKREFPLKCSYEEV
ncbi:MAG: ATP-dependent Clp protease adaptor ClpS [Spirochaetes bacterium]|nr:ATP-dependent Clp protease adaptor ClpS [Spirochaetota bacterium]